MNVTELLSDKYRPILEDKCTHELSNIIKKEDLPLNEIIPYFSTEENFKKSPDCFKKIISEKSNKEIELYLQLAHIQATGYDTFRYSIQTMVNAFWDAFDIDELKKMSPIGGPVFVANDVVNEVSESAWKSIQTGDIKYMDEMINKAKSEAQKATEDVKKVTPEIENDSISDKPIPAPKDNDTIISPEQEKKANDSDY
jgi:endonuclease IV